MTAIDWASVGLSVVALAASLATLPAVRDQAKRAGVAITLVILALFAVVAIAVGWPFMILAHWRERRRRHSR